MSQARRKRYRDYLEPNSTSKVPRSTVHNQNTRNEGEPADIRPAVIPNREQAARGHGEDIVVPRPINVAPQSPMPSESSDDNEGSPANSPSLLEESGNLSNDEELETHHLDGSNGRSLSESSDDDEGSLVNSSSPSLFEDSDNRSDESSDDDEGSPANSSPPSLFEESDNRSDDEESEGIVSDEAEGNLREEGGWKKREYLDTPLTPFLSKTKFEALMLIMHYSMRFNLTGVALEALLKLVNCLLDTEAIPSSLFMFNQIFKNVDEPVQCHLYCESCFLYLGVVKELIDDSSELNQFCQECDTPFDIITMNNGNFFLTIPVTHHLKTLLEDPSFAKSLNYRFERSVQENIVSDIFDGSHYKDLAAEGKILSNSDNISITFNTDGAPVFKSCKSSMWPIQFIVNELPPSERFHPSNVLLAGLWFGSKEPKMDLFLRPFVEESLTLQSNGIKWIDDEHRLRTSKVLVTCCCLDSVAKPMVTNTTQFNGYYGCCYCKHPGTNTGGNQIRYTNLQDIEMRHDAQMREDMNVAHNTKTSVFGVKGISPLTVLPEFDIVHGVVIDYLHATLLGVGRTLANLWFDSTSHGKDYYIGPLVGHVDARLHNLKPPQTISRTPRPISDRRHWKGNEWRAWLLFYSLPCLKDILPIQYLQHVMLLVSGIYILVQDSITHTQLDLAEYYLAEFVARYELLYGETCMTYNVHLMTHLGQMVRSWGPLWAYSAFCFESGNGFLLRLVHGTRGVTTQVFRKYMLHKSLPKMIQLYNISHSTLEHCSSLMSYKSAQNIARTNSNGVSIVLLGTSQLVNLQETELQAVLRAGVEVRANAKVESHKKMIINGVKYHSKTYTRPKKTNDYTIKMNNGSFYAIQKILLIGGEVYMLARLIRLENSSVTLPDPNTECSAPHIKVCNMDSPDLSLLSAHNVSCKVILLHCGNEIYLSEFPNIFEKD